jgi:hypothetical protein
VGVSTVVKSAAIVGFSAIISPAFGSTSLSFPDLPASPGTMVDGAVKSLFSSTSVPAGAVGDTLRYWSFNAANGNPVAPVIFDSSGAVVGYGATVTPVGTGLQSALFGLQAGTDVLAAGNTVGFFYPGAASISFSSGGPNVNYKPLGAGEDLAIGTATTSSAGNRTYDVNFTASSDQVTLGVPSSAPGGSAIADGSVSTYYAYTPVTSQYEGHTLTSWSFYALNSNVVVPVIYSAGPFSHVIGYGEAVTPDGTDQLQTFDYVPVVGTNVLATGEMLGWYTPGAGAIAFDLTGGTGILTNANFAALQTGIYPTSAIPNRNYYVGFTTAVPEPTGVFALATGMGGLLLRRKIRN